MADKKVSELVEATSAALADVFLIVQGGISKRITKTNLFKLLESLDVVGQVLSRKTVETLTLSGAVSTSIHNTIVNNTGTTVALTLAAGVVGMTKTIAVLANTGTITVTVTGGLGFTTVGLTSVGSSITVHFVNGSWVIVGSHNVTIS